MTLSLDNRILIIGLSSIISMPALAIEPASVPIGEMRLTPTINLVTGHNDNITSSETNEVKSGVTRISPNIALQAETENASYLLNYSFEKGVFHSSSADNYLDHDLSATINIIGNSRNRIDVYAGYRKGHDARDASTGSTESEPLEFDVKSLQGIYTYGGKKAKGRIELSGLYEDKQYTNFSATTDSKEYSKHGAGAAFYYRVTAKTSALFEINRNSIDYDTSNRDNTNTKYLTGVKWEATAKTSGEIKAGWSDKDFDDASIADTDGGTWDAIITWNPKTYSTFTFYTGQDFSEASEANTSFIDTKNYGLNWDHFWNDRLKSVISYNLTEEDYSNSTRDDSTKSFTLGLNHDTQRWLNLGLGYTLTDKNSNVTGNSYKTNEIMFTLQASL